MAMKIIRGTAKYVGYPKLRIHKENEAIVIVATASGPAYVIDTGRSTYTLGYFDGGSARGNAFEDYNAPLTLQNE